MAEAVAEEYRSSLADLNFNSKPHINMLTIIAEENEKFAPMIVDTILTHVKSVPPDLKLPSLYLVDSIMKNIGGQYITLFSKHMITLFSSVFEKVEETTRSALYKLRQTWNDILPKSILYGVDLKVNGIDPAWPITAIVAAPASGAAAATTAASSSKNPIHVNPKFLGGPSTQSPNAAKSQEKPAAIAKSEPTLKDKDTEVMEMKKKQEEMLRLIEEKKTQLKALEQKKMEMAAKQKKSAVLVTPTSATVMPPQVILQKKFVNHRDPRLKKSLALSHTPADIKGPEKLTAVSLQSVVVVPNSKLPPDAINGSVAATLAAKTKEEKPAAPANNTFHTHEQSIAHKGTKNVDKFSKGSPKDKNNSPRESLTRNCKNIKKHSTSPDNKLGVNAKRFCKQPTGKPKRMHFQEGDSQHVRNEPHPIKKQKTESPKSKNKVNADTHSSGERLSESILFGTEDKDYRHQVRSDERLQSKHAPQSQTKSVHTANARVPQEGFNPKDHNSTALPVSASERNPHTLKPILPENVAEQNPVVKQIFVETYRPEIDQKIKQENKIIEGNAIKVENVDRSYTSVPVVAKGRIPPPITSSIMLDGKNRTIHFVKDRAVTVMDNNEPREVMFAGPPRNVYIEGLPHPLLLEFGGRQVEFIIEGKRNVVRFGAPSREIYINNFPYEAKFGGPHFAAVLEDQKEHKIRIDGPPPQVMVSEKPPFDLYEHCNLNKNIKKEPEDPTLLQDVDMRLKPSHLLQSSMLPECRKDMDWRHVASSSDASQIPWNGPQNSFETYNDVPGARNYGPGVPTPLEFNNNSNPMTAKSEHFFSERNSNMNHSTWPHPAYREAMDQKSQHIPPNTTWEIKPPSTLPPPPSIPHSLNLSTQSANLSLTNLSGPPSLPNLQSLNQLPNMTIPPPSWNPLPPPPMFTGAVPDALNLPAIGANPIPTSEPAMSLPINVNTIYEKLIAAGIIPKKAEEPQGSATETASKDEKASEEAKEEEEIEIPDIRLTPKCLRQFNSAVIALLYKGSQCATCGMRFKEIQSEQYSRHLDWHFRMNRREKDGAKKAYSRRLYYEIKDWIQFKEIEEAEERMPSYFELQTDGEACKNEEKEKIQSVPASECESEKCSVCGEQFQLFWVEEEEEWHLKHAVRHDGEAYHPMCYEDHKKAIELANREPEPEIPEENLADSIKEETEEPMSVDNATSEPINEEEIKQEQEDIPKDDQSPPEATEDEEKPEPTAPESPEDKVSEESAKEEVENPIEDKEATTEMEEDKPEASASATESEEADKVKKVESPVKVSVPAENVKLNSEAELEGSPEEEFRPPTPDPRFEVLPPVFKGTELSALCTIM